MIFQLQLFQRCGIRAMSAFLPDATEVEACSNMVALQIHASLPCEALQRPRSLNASHESRFVYLYLAFFHGCWCQFSETSWTMTNQKQFIAIHQIVREPVFDPHPQSGAILREDQAGSTLPEINESVWKPRCPSPHSSHRIRTPAEFLFFKFLGYPGLSVLKRLFRRVFFHVIARVRVLPPESMFPCLSVL